MILWFQRSPNPIHSQSHSSGSETLMFWKFSWNLSEVTGIGIFSVWFLSLSGPFTNIIQVAWKWELFNGLYLFREPVKANMKVCMHRRKRALYEVSHSCSCVVSFFHNKWSYVGFPTWQKNNWVSSRHARALFTQMSFLYGTAPLIL